MIVLLIALLLTLSTAFQIQTLDVQPSNYIINTVTSYSIFLTREFNPVGIETNWNITPVPAGSLVTITFPSVYNTSVGYTCDAPYEACYVSGQKLILPGLFPIDTFLRNMTIIVQGVLNPLPAIITDEFMGTVGDETTVPSSNPNAIVALEPASLTGCTITFSPTSVNRINNMVITATPTNPISLNGTVLVTFPPSGSWFYDIQSQSFGVTTGAMVCTNATSNVLSTMNCSGSINSNNARFVNLSSLFSTNNSLPFGFQINSILSPPTTFPKDQLTITTLIDGYQLDTCTAPVTGLQPNTMLMTITPLTTLVVNRQVSLRFALNLTDIVNTADAFVITFPTGTRLNITNINAGGSTTITNVQTVNSTVVTFSQTTSARTFAAGIILNITLTNYIAPPSTQQTQAISLAIQRDGFSKMLGTGTLQAVMSNLSFTVSQANTIVNTNTSYTFLVTISDGLLSSGRIRIDFPSTIKQGWTSPNCAVAVGTNLSSTPTCTMFANSVILTSLNSSTALINSQTINLTINGLINPSTTEPSAAFTVTTFYSTTDDTSVATATMGSVTATVSTLNSSTFVIEPSSWRVGDTNVAYTIGFTVNNPVPVGGFVLVGVPLDIQAVVGSITGQCFLSNNNVTYSSTPCTATTTSTASQVNFTSVAPSFAIASNSTIYLRVTTIFTNPANTLSVGSFYVATYSNTGFLIDRLTVGLNVAMKTPADFADVQVNATSKTNSGVGNYTVQLIQGSTFLASSFLDILLPTEITPSISTTKCFDITTNAPLTCNVTSSLIIVNLSSTTSKSLFGVILTNIKNPPSLKPSGTFGFRTRTPDTIGIYSFNLSTVSVTNTIPSAFIQVAGQFTPQTLNSSITANISFTPTSSITGWIVVSLASSFNLPTVQCQSFSAFTGSCAVSGNNVNINGNFGSSLMSVTITGISSPTTLPTDSTTVTSYDSSGSIIDQITSGIVFSISCALPCRTCSSAGVCTSCYNNTVVTPNVFYNSGTNECLAICYTGFYADQSQGMCVNCATICASCTGNATNCLSCITTSTNKFLNTTQITQSNGTIATSGTCLSTCDFGFYPNTNFICVPCLTPCRSCLTELSCLSCFSGRYYYENNCLLTCPTNITIANGSTNICDFCSTNCLTCENTTSTCTSCVNSLVLQSNACKSGCTSPLVNKSGICGPCDSPCLTCSVTSTNCTSCVETSTKPHYLNNVCYSTCPPTYYVISSTGPCLSCSSLTINCQNCLNSTACITCDLGFVFFNKTASCLSVVPDGYVNISGIAEQCTGDCATCIVTQSNCTSCTTLNLYGNTCVTTCPSGFVGSFGKCLPCTSPCLTCNLTVETCTSCVSTTTPLLFLSGTQCIATCPEKTYANITNQRCTECVSPCLTCSSLQVCQTCIGGTFFFQGACSSICPDGYLGLDSICQACRSPCKKCEITTSTCKACLSGLTPELYLSGTSCVPSSSCPNDTFANQSSNECTKCTPPCLTCLSASVCLTCIEGYNLQGTNCSSSCPARTMPIGSICTPCNATCQSCSGTVDTCLSCVAAVPALYLSGDRCISTCPDTTYPNGTNFQCTSCLSPCSSCTSRVNCSSCVGGFFLYLKRCNPDCPQGYVGIGVECVQCSSGCVSCSNSTLICDACLAGYYMLNLTKQCLTNCPNGLYQDPISMTCIGCTPPCAGCTGTTNNCTLCLTGSLYNNSCVDKCPQKHYEFNRICVPCSTGCLVCSSDINCTVCESNYYYFGKSCVSSCPSSYAIVKNQTCTQCTTANCVECTNSDYCLLCNSPMLVQQGNCLTSCSDSLISNGTHCITPAPVAPTGIFPIPFTLAGLVIIIIALVSKFHSPSTFASGAIYGFVGVFEWGSLLALIILYSQMKDPVIGALLFSLVLLYIGNFVALWLMLTVYKKDDRLESWVRHRCSSKTSYIITLIIATAMSHKYLHVMFSRLFNLFAFKAPLSSVRQFYYLHLLSLLMLLQSFVSIGAASYIVYQSSPAPTTNPLFLCSLDLVLISIINVIFAGANALKDEMFFIEYDENGVKIGKKEYVDGDVEGKSGQQGGEAEEKESAFCGKYSFGEIDAMNSREGLRNADEPSADGFAPEFYIDCGRNLVDLADMSVQALEILDQEMNTPTLNGERRKNNTGSQSSINTKAFHNASTPKKSFSKQKELQRMLKQKEEDVMNMKKKVERIEKEREGLRSASSSGRGYGIVNPRQSSFTSAAEMQDPLNMSKTIKRSQRMSPLHESKELSPSRGNSPQRKSDSSSGNSPGVDLSNSKLNRSKRFDTPPLHPNIEQQQKIRPMSGDSPKKKYQSPAKYDNQEIEKSDKQLSDDDISKQPPGKSSRRNSPDKTLYFDGDFDGETDNDLQYSKKKKKAENIIKGPIILTANGNSSFSQIRRSTPKIETVSPKKKDPRPKSYRTMELHESSQKDPISRPQSKLLYDTSDIQDRQSRSITNPAAQSQPSLRLSPQLLTVKSKLSQEEIKEYHRRVPLMVGVATVEEVEDKLGQEVELKKPVLDKESAEDKQ